MAEEFEARGALRPQFFEADAAEREGHRAADGGDSAAHAEKIDIFVSNVSFALRTLTLADYKKRSLFKTLEYSTWPLVDYTRRIKERFGQYPRYVLAISSDGPGPLLPGLRLRGGIQGAAGVLLAVPLRPLLAEGSRVNVLRFGTVDTDSFRAIFGEEFFTYMERHGVPVGA